VSAAKTLVDPLGHRPAQHDVAGNVESQARSAGVITSAWCAAPSSARHGRRSGPQRGMLCAARRDRPRRRAHARDRADPVGGGRFPTAPGAVLELGGATDAQLDACDCRRVGRGADMSALPADTRGRRRLRRRRLPLARALQRVVGELMTAAMAVARGFIKGFLSTLVFRQGVLTLFWWSGILPRAPYDMTRVPPLGVPAVVCLASGVGSGEWSSRPCSGTRRVLHTGLALFSSGPSCRVRWASSSCSRSKECRWRVGGTPLSSSRLSCSTAPGDSELRS
jgi:hypothetical protein